MERWNLEDSARAEIPMTADHCEAYTMGVAIDFSSQMPLPLSESKYFISDHTVQWYALVCIY